MITLYAMPFLREIRDMLLFAHSDNLISEEECLLFYDLNTYGEVMSSKSGKNWSIR